MDILDELKNGNIKLYQLDNIIWEKVYKKDPEKWHLAAKDASFLRLKFIEEKTNKKFPNIKKSYINTSRFRNSPTTGIEQKIGSAATPLGVAGPLKINGEYANGEFFIPLATNEAALIAGLNRGCKTVNMSGGVKVMVTRDWMARAPVIEAESLEQARDIVDEINMKGQLFKNMKTTAESGSKVSRLLDIHPFQLGRRIHLRFLFQTGDSMGMNSATKYSSEAVKVLLRKYKKCKLLSLTGNMCTDKKASHVNILLGRGKSVEAEVFVSKKTLKDVFDVSPKDVEKLSFVKNYEGSALSGTVTGFNLNAANTIAALFIATGQDAAQIVESSSCFTRAEATGEGLFFAVTLPSLEVATVGGGTGYGTAKECLEIMQCSGPGKNPGDNAKKLAEIVAAAVVCQELNLLCTEAHSYELAESHIKLARGK